jgi:hypothetical protein
MKKNYIFKTIKTALVIFAIALSTTFANAQTTVDAVITQGTVTLDDDGAGGTLAFQSYPSGQAVSMTGIATVAGQGTFNVTFTVTPATIAATDTTDEMVLKIMKGETGSWGVVYNAANILFRGNQFSRCTIDNVVFSNFTGTLSAANLDSYTFTNAVITSGSSGNDRFGYSVGGTDYNSTAAFGEDPQTIDLRSYGTNLASIDPALTSITALDIYAANISSRNAWSIQSLTVQVTLDDSTLGVNDVVQKDAFSIFPTIVENTFTVNKAFETLQLFDLTGKTVKTFNSTDALEVTGLAKGLYIVKIQSATGGISTSKMIVK